MVKNTPRTRIRETPTIRPRGFPHLVLRFRGSMQYLRCRFGKPSLLMRLANFCQLRDFIAPLMESTSICFQDCSWTLRVLEAPIVAMLDEDVCQVARTAVADILICLVGTSWAVLLTAQGRANRIGGFESRFGFALTRSSLVVLAGSLDRNPVQIFATRCCVAIGAEQRSCDVSSAMFCGFCLGTLITARRQMHTKICMWNAGCS